MDDRTRIALGLGIGAALGGFAAFLLFTERGTSFRSELEPQLEQLVGEAPNGHPDALDGVEHLLRHLLDEVLRSKLLGGGRQNKNRPEGDDL